MPVNIRYGYSTDTLSTFEYLDFIVLLSSLWAMFRALIVFMCKCHFVVVCVL